MYKLPVLSTIRETYQFIGGQLSALVDYAIVPVIIGGIFASLFFLGFFNELSQANGPINIYGVELDRDRVAKLSQLSEFLPTQAMIILAMLAGIANFAFYILFSVAWHRRYLLGPAVTSAREIFTWRDRHWRFLGSLILLALILMLIALLLAIPLFLVLSPLLQSSGAGSADPASLVFPALMVNIIMAIPIALLTCKLMLVLPAAAAERQNFRFAESAALTRGNLWRIVFVFFLGWYLPYTIVSSGVNLLLVSPFLVEIWLGSFGMVLVFMLLQQIVVFAGVTIGVTTLSIVFQRLVENAPAVKSRTA